MILNTPWRLLFPDWNCLKAQPQKSQLFSGLFILHKHFYLQVVFGTGCLTQTVYELSYGSHAFQCKSMQIGFGVGLGLLVSIVLLSILFIRSCRKRHILQNISVSYPRMPFIPHSRYPRMGSPSRMERSPRMESSGHYLNRQEVEYNNLDF